LLLSELKFDTSYERIIIIYTSWVGLTPNYPTESYILFTYSRSIQTIAFYQRYGGQLARKKAVSFVTEYKLPKVTELSIFAEDTLPLNARAYELPRITIYTTNYAE